VIADTTFLVDFERETMRREFGPAARFLESHPSEVLGITFTIAGELAAGASLGADRGRWEEFIRPFRFFGYQPEVAWRFGAICRSLRESGAMMGANDLWIAATAMAFGESIVTRNADKFSRVTGLVVLGY
jgi:predicted nucleic acid-binding protein